jgi:TPR repeat protein
LNATCVADESIKLIENSATLDDLVASIRVDEIPYREEAVAILAEWLGRGEAADARLPVERARMAAAMEVFQNCAVAGRAGASFLLGAMYSKAVAQQPDLPEAQRHFEIAVASGMSLGNLGIAVVAYRANKVELAEQSLRKLLASNERFSPELIGQMLRSGTVLPKSSKNAKIWLEIAATKDNSAVAQHALYEMYSTGDGVVRNDLEARKWREMRDANSAGGRDWNAENEILDGMERVPTTRPQDF